jgi:serine/threonine-protein kinase
MTRWVNTVVVHPGDEVAERYRLEELQGLGPMSEVWRAHDRRLDRTVALKVLSPTADLERFRREARALAALTHENVMRVYDYGEDVAGPFMALEWLPGGTLEDRLPERPLPREEAYRIAKGIAAGLSHLHARGLVHRDLKPANVLFDEESRPKLGDFGLARRAAGHGTLTEAGTVLGTAAYISPEQAAGEPAGPASDVYSFGVVLFRMLTGALPFVADDALALATLHRHAPAPAVESLQPDAPPALAAVASAALRKDPALRPVNGEALLAALGSTPGAVPPTPDKEQTQILTGDAEPTPRRIGRRTATVALALVLLGASGAVLAWAITRPPAVPAEGGSTGSVAGTSKSRGSAGAQTSSPTTVPASNHATGTRARTASTTAPTRATTAHTTTTTPTTTGPLTTTTAATNSTTAATTTTATTTDATGTTAQTSADSTTAPAATGSAG